MPDTTYSVQGHAESATRTRVEAGGHTLTVDVPTSSGGDDAGPSPVDYVLAGLVGCLNLTGHLVADEMGLTLERLDVEAAGPLNLARMTGRSTEERAGLKDVRVTLTVEAEADDETLARWSETVTDRCPVSDIIGAATPLAVEVVAPMASGV